MGYQLNVKTRVEDCKTIWHNLAEFIDAACLGGVSGFAIYASRFKPEWKINHFWSRLLLFAGLVIALQAFVLLAKHFNKKG